MTPEDLKVRELLVEHIGQFAVNLFDAANDEAALHKELQRFLNFFCKALAAAERDGRSSVLTASVN